MYLKLNLINETFVKHRQCLFKSICTTLLISYGWWVRHLQFHNFNFPNLKNHIQAENKWLKQKRLLLNRKHEQNYFDDNGRFGHDVLLWEFLPLSVDPYGRFEGLLTPCRPAVTLRGQRPVFLLAFKPWQHGSRGQSSKLRFGSAVSDTPGLLILMPLMRSENGGRDRGRDIYE